MQWQKLDFLDSNVTKIFFIKLIIFTSFLYYNLSKTILYKYFSHELNLTKSRLLKLFEHDFVLKIWDSKEYCSARTKFDKPKPFKFSKQDEINEERIHETVIDICNVYLKQIPNELHDRLSRKLPNQPNDSNLIY